MQGILRANRRPLLTPSSALRLLRSTGSPQADAPGRPRTQRIGNRPNIRQMVASLFGSAPDAEEGQDTLLASTGAIELNLDGKVTINVRSADVTVNVGDKKIELSGS